MIIPGDAIPSIDEFVAEERRRAAERARDAAMEDAAASRERCRSFSQFVREAWHVLEPSTPYVHGWHVDAKCEHLEACSRGEITRLQINEPPGCMKSLAASVMWQAWEWGPLGRPDLRYLSTSYEQGYAKRDARKTRDLVLSEWYQARWPIELTRVAEMSFANSFLGEREAKPFGSLTAGRGNRLVIDDPHSTETAESDLDRARAERIFCESVPSRLNDPERDVILVIMHRLHGRDVCGVIERLGLPYVRLVLPMEFEPERRFYTPLGWTDPREYDGELLFPERWGREQVEELKKATGSHAWAGQYQQRPAPREGAMFKRAWFDRPRLGARPADGITWVRHWDLAASRRKDSARTAGVLMGARYDGTFVVADCQVTQDEGAAVRRLIRSVAQSDGRGVAISLPQDPGQAGKVQAQDYVSMLAGWVVQANPETGDKVTRAEPFAAQCEAGNVDLVDGDWVEGWIEELCSFPSGKYKDRVDASSGAFAWLTVSRDEGAAYAAALMTAV